MGCGGRGERWAGSGKRGRWVVGSTKLSVLWVFTSSPVDVTEGIDKITPASMLLPGVFHRGDCRVGRSHGGHPGERWDLSHHWGEGAGCRGGEKYALAYAFLWNVRLFWQLCIQGRKRRVWILRNLHVSWWMIFNLLRILETSKDFTAVIDGFPPLVIS